MKTVIFVKVIYIYNYFVYENLGYLLYDLLKETEERREKRASN